MPEKILVAFDFDHTLIDDNSDYYVKRLAPDGTIPDEIKAKFSTKGWTEYMGAIFTYLHQNGTTEEDIVNCMKEIPFIKGVENLLHFLQKEKFEVIIISDSNSVFIDVILKAAGLDHTITAIYTNPAKFDDNGCLTIEYYHTQDWCTISTVNLCKGHILDQHISEANKNSVQYSVVCYVGDGSNDLCPSLHLRPCDFVFARKGYTLLKKIHKLPEGQLRAKVVPWDSGEDIQSTLEGILARN